jgi:hypothetical protein
VRSPPSLLIETWGRSASEARRCKPTCRTAVPSASAPRVGEPMFWKLLSTDSAREGELRGYVRDRLRLALDFATLGAAYELAQREDEAGSIPPALRSEGNDPVLEERTWAPSGPPRQTASSPGPVRLRGVRRSRDPISVSRSALRTSASGLAGVAAGRQPLPSSPASGSIANPGRALSAALAQHPAHGRSCAGRCCRTCPSASGS